METITFLRHGEYRDSGKLSNNGVAQVRKRACSLINVSPFDLAISSSAERAKETAEILLSSLNLHIPLLLLEQLYLPEDPEDRVSVKKLLENLGASPLSVYIEHDDHMAWQRYADEAYKALLSCLATYRAKNILVIGHGNIINSLGLKLNPKATVLQKTYFEFCEGFILFQESGELRLLLG